MRPLTHSFEVGYGLLCWVTGAALLGSGMHLRVSVVQTLPFPLVLGWALAMFLGGTAIVTGVLWRRKAYLSIGIERAGLRLTGSAWLVYALMLNFVPTPVAALSYFVVAFLVGSVVARLRVLYLVERRL